MCAVRFVRPVQKYVCVCLYELTHEYICLKNVRYVTQYKFQKKNFVLFFKHINVVYKYKL